MFEHVAERAGHSYYCCPEFFLLEKWFDVLANQNDEACVLCLCQVIVVLGGTAVFVKYHTKLEALASHSLHKPEVDLSEYPSR